MVKLINDLINNFTITLSLCQDNRFTYLEPIVRPRAEFHETRLLIEGKVSNVYFARWFENCRRSPKHLAGVMQNSLSHCCHTVFSVRTENKARYFELMRL